MGGAVFNHQGTLTVVNSTISANSAIGGSSWGALPGSGFGGGIFNLNGAVTITNSTLAVNTAGAVYDLGYDQATARSASVTLVNSILSNTPAGSPDLTVDGSSGGASNRATAAVTATAPNIVMTSSVSGGTIAGSPTKADPALSPLQNYGGPGMATMVPASTSPAIHTGQAAACPATDERGFARPQGSPCDQGAVEVGAPPPAVPEASVAILLPLSALVLGLAALALSRRHQPAAA
jgi:hypothetical protein